MDFNDKNCYFKLDFSQDNLWDFWDMVFQYFRAAFNILLLTSRLARIEYILHACFFLSETNFFGNLVQISLSQRASVASSVVSIEIRFFQ